MWTKEELEKKTKEELVNIIIKMQIDIREERDEIYQKNYEKFYELCRNYVRYNNVV